MRESESALHGVLTSTDVSAHNADRVLDEENVLNMGRIAIPVWLSVLIGCVLSAETGAGITQSFSFTCSDGATFSVRYDGPKSEHATLAIDGAPRSLNRVRSASGTRYQSGDGAWVFWEKNGEALVQLKGATTHRGCVRDAALLQWHIAPQRRPCVGAGPMECLVVNGKLFYDNVVGFDYEPGYDYTVRVRRSRRENPPADASAYTYTLVELVDKTAQVDRGETAMLITHAWQWQKTLYANDTMIAPKDATQFILRFADDRFSAGTDCNDLAGTYEVDAKRGKLSFGPIAATRKLCPGETQETVFTAMLQETEGFLITEKGNLVLTLKLDTGSVIFTPVPPATR